MLNSLQLMSHIAHARHVFVTAQFHIPFTRSRCCFGPRVGPSPSRKWKAPAYLPNVKSGNKCTRDFSRSSEPTCPRYTKIKKKKKKRNWDGYTNIGDCINCCTVRTLRRQEVGKKGTNIQKKGRKMICNGRSQPVHFL